MDVLAQENFQGGEARTALELTLQRWMTRYQRFGLAALVGKTWVDAGARRTVLIKMKATIEIDRHT